MSLINQMLRDLEQRNGQQSQPAVVLDVRKVGHRPNNKYQILWLGPLIALLLAYVWRQNQLEKAVLEPAAVIGPRVIAELQRPQIAIVELPAPIQPISSIPTAVLLDKEKPEIKQEIAEKPKQADVKSEINAAAKTLQKIKPVLSQVKPLSSREQAERLFRKAQISDSALLAKEVLEQALELDPLYLPARTLLLQNLLKSHAADAELIGLVDNSLSLFPGNLLFIKTRAHLYIKDKNFTAAVNVLQQISPDTVNDPAYLALLAVCYQQLQNFSQAAPIYRSLTEMQPEKAENWLGLAICADRLNQSSMAVEAYRQALDKNTLHSEVVNYINQRLSLLN